MPLLDFWCIQPGEHVDHHPVYLACLTADQLHLFQSVANRTRLNQRSTDSSTQSIRKDVGGSRESWRDVILKYLNHKT
jgi:hypothetical protein